MSEDKLLAEWFWTDRWTLSSAFLLPLHARGLYREMLTQAWRRGARLPKDHEAIRRATGVTKEEWKRAWPLVEPHWRVDGDALVNDTQLEIYAKAKAAYDAASERGRKGGRARHKRSPGAAQAEPEQPATFNPSTAQDQDQGQASRSLDLGSPPKEQGEILRARDAYAGKVLRVPKFLDDDFVRMLNGRFFDLAAFYQALDSRLAQTGEPWDIRWIRERFEAESPTPERRRKPRVAEQLREPSDVEIAARDARYQERQRRAEEAEALARQVIPLLPADEREQLRATCVTNLTNCYRNLKLTDDVVARAMVQEVLDRYRGRPLQDVIAELQERQKAEVA